MQFRVTSYGFRDKNEIVNTGKSINDSKTPSVVINPDGGLVELMIKTGQAAEEHRYFIEVISGQIADLPEFY
jgi:hypothetical protein